MLTRAATDKIPQHKPLGEDDQSVMDSHSVKHAVVNVEIFSTSRIESNGNS